MDRSKPSGSQPGPALAALAVGDSVTIDALGAAGIRTPIELARRPLALLQNLPELRGIANLPQLYRKAIPAAVVLARQLRESRLSGSAMTIGRSRSGIASLVDGPTYEGLFREPWSSFAMPGALESNEGYLAYLVALYRYVTDTLEALDADTSGSRITLARRRPDLADMMLDEGALAAKTAVEIVNRILEARISAALRGEAPSVDDALLLKHRPFNLPYERYMAQINHVLRRDKRSLGDVIRLADEAYPYFVVPGLSSARAGAALRMDTGLGPVQQEILVEAPHADAGGSGAGRVSPRTGVRTPRAPQDSFLRDFYDVDDPRDLIDIEAFCRATQTRKDDVESLFSIERLAPAASPNAPGIAAASSLVFGSAYIHGGEGDPVTVVTNGQGEFHQVTGATLDRLDRIQRLIRLSRWLDLPFDQTDQVLMAAIRAEQGAKASLVIRITELTVRALGLFCHLRRHHAVSAEDFAALLDGPALYARGGDVPQFDRIFNRTDLYAEPIVLDGKSFTIQPSEVDRPRVTRLCSALGISFETYLYFARIIAQGMSAGASDGASANEDSLAWSHEVLAAFYRMVRLPAYLGISGVEAVALLQLLAKNGPQFVGRLVSPTIAAYEASTLADTLNVIHALSDAVAWCREHGFDVPWLHRTLVRMAPPSPASLTYDELLKQINVGLPAVLLQEPDFLDLGLPPLVAADGKPETWLSAMHDMVDSEGVVLVPKDEADEASDDYVDRLAVAVGSLLDERKVERLDRVQKIVSLLLDSRSGQETLVLESLGKHFGLDVAQVRPVLAWASTSRVFLISQVLDVFSQTDPADQSELIAALERLDVRAGIVQRVSLSAEALNLYLERPGVFESASRDETPGAPFRDISFPLLFAFARYIQVVRAARQPESAVIEYLRLINEVDLSRLSASEIALIRDDAAVRIAAFTGTSVWNVLEAAQPLNAYGVVMTVRELDRLMRVRSTCDALRLDAATVFELASLDATSSTRVFRQAAEGALGTLAREDNVAHGVEEVGQSERSTISAYPAVLVAQAGGQSVIQITVRDFYGNARQDVEVTWSCNLSKEGALDPATSKTDVNGVATTTLLDAKALAEVEVVARFGLGRRLIAPTVLFDCDDESLKMTVEADSPKPSEAKAGYRETIGYAVTLKDKYGNAGRGRTVRWSADLASPRFSPLNSVANDAGRAATLLASLSPGPAVVVATCDANGTTVAFKSVAFTDEPYLASVEIEPVLAKNVPQPVRCIVRSIDGSPIEGAKIAWSVVDQKDVIIAPSVTDAHGEAVAIFTPAKDGTFQVSAVANVPGTGNTLALRSRVSRVQTVTLKAMSPVPVDSTIAISPDEGDVELNFKVAVSPPMAGLDVTWSFAGNTYVTKTRADGVSEWLATTLLEDDETVLDVVARLGDAASVTFAIKVRREAVVVSLEALPGPVLLASPSEPGVFVMGLGHVHVFRAKVMSASGHPVHKAHVVLDFDVDDPAAGPGQWGFQMTPAPLTEIPVDEYGQVDFRLSTEFPHITGERRWGGTLKLRAAVGQVNSEPVALRCSFLIDAAKAGVWAMHAPTAGGAGWWVYGYLAYASEALVYANAYTFDLHGSELFGTLAPLYGGMVVYSSSDIDSLGPGAITLVPTLSGSSTVLTHFVKDGKAFTELTIHISDGPAPAENPWKIR